MIWIILGLLAVLSLILLALATWIEANPKSKVRKLTGNGALPTRLLPEVSAKTPMPPVKPPKPTCGNCSSCKCNTTKSSGPR